MYQIIQMSSNLHFQPVKIAPYRLNLQNVKKIYG